MYVERTAGRGRVRDAPFPETYDATSAAATARRSTAGGGLDPRDLGAVGLTIVA
jgi:hypothetical protein